ncbi:Conserved_hypothetical protein [Hexamita inflata]|uniref:Myb-like DNA-binding domain-containing protein n=1 Tax=Hexamita inflata TaxID=28002 RepID=A0AA86TW62_9EUKA|nr:Conserved hypothetical protein [Hexamita inflata]CAI9965644.1 Conserved hypothetical protein [Hexamita inflata]
MNSEQPRTKQYAHKTKWSEEEVQTFFGLFPDFGSNFKLYLPHLNRTYSQIKGFYHNYQRRAELQQGFEGSLRSRQKAFAKPKSPACNSVFTISHSPLFEDESQHFTPEETLNILTKLLEKVIDNQPNFK